MLYTHILYVCVHIHIHNASVESNIKSNTKCDWGRPVSSGFLLLRKGLLEFDTLAPKMFCSGNPRSLWVGRGGVGFFWSVRLLESDMSLCPSVGPSSCLSAPSTSPPIYLSIHLWTVLSSRISGREGTEITAGVTV